MTIFRALLSSILVLIGTVGESASAVTVYFYGVHAPNDTNLDPAPLSLVQGSGGMYLATGGGVNLSVAGGFGDPFFCRSNATLIPSGRSGNVLYHDAFGLQGGAIPGDPYGVLTTAINQRHQHREPFLR